MVDVPPRPTKPPAPTKPKASFVSIILAFFVALMCFIVAAFFSQGFAALFFMVILVVFGLIGFHYIVWGWWLGESIKHDAQEDA